MLRKYTPLIILALFVAGSYFIIKGMNRASQMTSPKTGINTKKH